MCGEWLVRGKNGKSFGRRCQPSSWETMVIRTRGCEHRQGWDLVVYLLLQSVHLSQLLPGCLKVVGAHLLTRRMRKEVGPDRNRLYSHPNYGWYFTFLFSNFHFIVVNLIRKKLFCFRTFTFRSQRIFLRALSGSAVFCLGLSPWPQGMAMLVVFRVGGLEAVVICFYPLDFMKEGTRLARTDSRATCPMTDEVRILVGSKWPKGLVRLPDRTVLSLSQSSIRVEG